MICLLNKSYDRKRYIDKPLEKETAINIQYVGNMEYYTVCTGQGKGVQKREKIKNNWSDSWYTGLLGDTEQDKNSIYNQLRSSQQKALSFLYNISTLFAAVCVQLLIPDVDLYVQNYFKGIVVDVFKANLKGLGL